MTAIRVQSALCETCIYRPSSPLNLERLEAEILDPRMAGHFRSFRACHHADDATVCCRGFWNRHKDHFDIGQVAQRLGAVAFVVIPAGQLRTGDRVVAQFAGAGE